MGNKNVERPERVSAPLVGDNSGFEAFAIILVGIAILYFAREVFLPFAIAVLLSFALQPVVSRLKRIGLPRVIAVVISVIFAFLVMAVFSTVVALQVNQLAKEIPTYQNNIITKIRSFKEMAGDNSSFERLSAVVERLGSEISEDTDNSVPATQAEDKEPLLVEISSTQRPIDTLGSLIIPIIGPLATTGLVIVVVIFMLLGREELRDRFIRLVGYNDLHRTTEALQDAGQRVSQYLLMQLVVNVTYGLPIGIGLWFIGVPNALLWGLLAIVLRFVPYIGPFIAAVLPLFLALAVAPGWTMVLWTAALFICMELISNNVVEPVLYGSRTGLSPLAIIAAAIFWTWLWGPVGLVLSTPLTVCLVVLGRHVPQFEFLQVLLGNEPVLDPPERLYQRLLSGNLEEAVDNAEETLEEEYLVDYYGKVAIPALLLGEEDRARGVLPNDQMKKVADTATTLISELIELVDEEEENDDGEAGDNASATITQLPDGDGKQVLCIGGRTDLDDVTAAMLGQVLDIQGANIAYVSHTQVEPSTLQQLNLSGFNSVVIVYLNDNSLGHARYLIRRLKRAAPTLRVGIVQWSRADTETLEKVASRINADFVASSMVGAIENSLSDEPAVPLAAARALRNRRAPLRDAKPVATG